MNLDVMKIALCNAMLLYHLPLRVLLFRYLHVLYGHRLVFYVHKENLFVFPLILIILMLCTAFHNLALVEHSLAVTGNPPVLGDCFLACTSFGFSEN